jgi:hypothetical protein
MANDSPREADETLPRVGRTAKGSLPDSVIQEQSGQSTYTRWRLSVRVDFSEPSAKTLGTQKTVDESGSDDVVFEKDGFPNLRLALQAGEGSSGMPLRRTEITDI